MRCVQVIVKVKSPKTGKCTYHSQVHGCYTRDNAVSWWTSRGFEVKVLAVKPVKATTVEELCALNFKSKTCPDL